MEEIKENINNKKKQNSSLKDIGDIIETIISVVFIIVIIFAFLLRPVTIDGNSMNNTFYNNDRVFMTNLFYTPKDGDVVIINHKKSYFLNENKVYEGDYPMQRVLIKRVVATAGQTLDINFDTGEVKRDGKTLSENYIAEPTLTNEGGFEYPITIPKGYVFVMGDNRNHSTDSRSTSVGLIPTNTIMGHVVCKYYPLSDFKFIG